MVLGAAAAVASLASIFIGERVPWLQQVAPSLMGVVSGVFTIWADTKAAVRFVARLKSPGSRTFSPCRRLDLLTDLIPGQRLRNRVKKWVADDVEHAIQLYKSGR